MIAALSIRLTNEREYLLGELVRRGEHRSVSVTVEGVNAAVRKRVVERFGRLFRSPRALATGQDALFCR
jgi:hypothetical protein